jgi:hypothetical protein
MPFVPLPADPPSTVSVRSDVLKTTLLTGARLPNRGNTVGTNMELVAAGIGAALAYAAAAHKAVTAVPIVRIT